MNVLFVHSMCYLCIQCVIYAFNVLFVHSMCYLCIQCVTYAFNVLIVQLFYIDMFYNTGLLEYLCGK